MKKMIKSLANKAVYAAFAVLGAASASAELVKTPILQTFDDVAEPVSVGYKVTGLPNNEVAMVYTNHLRTATWTVPANLKNVEFLVVGGGGAGGNAESIYGPGGGGGGVVTGILTAVSRATVLEIFVGKGGEGSNSKSGAASEQGGTSKVTVSESDWIVAYGGGGGRQTAFTSEIGSSAGGCPISNSNSSSFISPILVDPENGGCGSIDDSPNGLI
ncbi:MAG: hypothetical protein J6V38_08740, partial [Kiritimatiellae bacterium]|nr:hypothetical protein [Kiritimatiellia bacterium]